MLVVNARKVLADAYTFPIVSSGLILYRTLSGLGLPPESIHVHFIAKGTNVFSASERWALSTPIMRTFLAVSTLIGRDWSA